MAKCKGITHAEWRKRQRRYDQTTELEAPCIWDAVKDGYCKRHHPEALLATVNKRLNKLTSDMLALYARKRELKQLLKEGPL